jgi:hypothetical protein
VYVEDNLPAAQDNTRQHKTRQNKTTRHNNNTHNTRHHKLVFTNPNRNPLTTLTLTLPPSLQGRRSPQRLLVQTASETCTRGALQNTTSFHFNIKHHQCLSSQKQAISFPSLPPPPSLSYLFFLFPCSRSLLSRKRIVNFRSFLTHQLPSGLFYTCFHPSTCFFSLLSSLAPLRRKYMKAGPEGVTLATRLVGNR